jgi:hypothetical protein
MQARLLLVHVLARHCSVWGQGNNKMSTALACLRTELASVQLVMQLARVHIQEQLNQAVGSFLSERTFTVPVEGEMSTSRLIQARAQGCVLSPTSQHQVFIADASDQKERLVPRASALPVHCRRYGSSGTWQSIETELSLPLLTATETAWDSQWTGASFCPESWKCHGVMFDLRFTWRFHTEMPQTCIAVCSATWSCNCGGRLVASQAHSCTRQHHAADSSGDAEEAKLQLAAVKLCSLSAVSGEWGSSTVPGLGSVCCIYGTRDRVAEWRTVSLWILICHVLLIMTAVCDGSLSRKPRLRPRGSATLTIRHPFILKLALTSPKSGVRSVGIVRYLTQATELLLLWQTRPVGRDGAHSDWTGTITAGTWRGSAVRIVCCLWRHNQYELQELDGKWIILSKSRNREDKSRILFKWLRIDPGGGHLEKWKCYLAS